MAIKDVEDITRGILHDCPQDLPVLVCSQRYCWEISKIEHGYVIPVQAVGGKTYYVEIDEKESSPNAIEVMLLKK